MKYILMHVPAIHVQMKRKMKTVGMKVLGMPSVVQLHLMGLIVSLSYQDQFLDLTHNPKISGSITDKHNLFFTLEYDGDYNRRRSVLLKIAP